ncbi:hypothetical protein ACQX38_11900, partial [Corynebacterium diphtheriae]
NIQRVVIPAQTDEPHQLVLLANQPVFPPGPGGVRSLCRTMSDRTAEGIILNEAQSLCNDQEIGS